QRTGIVGWALMMWVIGAALVAIARASREIRDHRLALVLWAIFSSGAGFLVSMTNFNAFYNPSVQALFCGLLGIGVAIVTHRRRRATTRARGLGAGADRHLRADAGVRAARHGVGADPLRRRRRRRRLRSRAGRCRGDRRARLRPSLPPRHDGDGARRAEARRA